MDLSDCYGGSGGADFSDLLRASMWEYGDDRPFERNRFLDSGRRSIYDQLERQLTQVLICRHVPNRSGDCVYARARSHLKLCLAAMKSLRQSL